MNTNSPASPVHTRATQLNIRTELGGRMYECVDLQRAVEHGDIKTIEDLKSYLEKSVEACNKEIETIPAFEESDTTDTERLQFFADHPETVSWIPERKKWAAHEPNTDVPVRFGPGNKNTVMITDETNRFVTYKEFDSLAEAIDWARGEGRRQFEASLGNLIGSFRKHGGTEAFQSEASLYKPTTPQ